MTVQELIDELMKVEDKSAIINVVEGEMQTMILFMKSELNGMVIIQ